MVCNLKNKKEKILYLYLEISALIFVPTIVYLAWLLLYCAIMDKSYVSYVEYSSLKELLLQYSIPFTICFGLFPLLFMVLIKKKKINELNLTIKNNKWYYFTLIVSLLVASFVFFLASKNTDMNTFREVITHNFFVSLTEELLTRGIILNELLGVFNPFTSIVLDGLVFGFILHCGGDMTINTLVRFPIGLILSLYHIKQKAFIHVLFCIGLIMWE